MTRRLVRLALPLTAAFALLAVGVVAVLRARPYQADDLRALLLPPPGCPAPCWLGIRLGETTVEQAIGLLRRAPGLTYFFDYSPSDRDTGRVIWRWRGAGGEVYGEMFFGNDVMSHITLRLPLREVWLALGAPDGGEYVSAVIAKPEGDMLPMPVYHWMYYREYGFRIHTTTQCADFWNERADITLAPAPDGVGDDAMAFRRRACDQIRQVRQTFGSYPVLGN